MIIDKKEKYISKGLNKLSSVTVNITHRNIDTKGTKYSYEIAKFATLHLHNIFL